MANTDPKQKLIAFLERRAWNPILKASGKRYEGADAKRLERVQQKTQAQRERYEKYRSAGEVAGAAGAFLRAHEAAMISPWN